MKISHRMLVPAAAMLGLAVPVVAGAQTHVTATQQESGFYIGALVGYSSIDVAKHDWENSVGQAFGSLPGGVLTSSSLSKGDTAYGVNIGYQVMRNFAVEVGYLDLGKTKGTAEGTVGTFPIPASVRGDFKSSGFEAALVGILPLQYGWALDARVGVYVGDTKLQLTGSTATDSASVEESASKSTFMGGVGGSYTFFNNWSVRLDYLYIDKVGDTGKIGMTAPVDVFSLGLRYMF
jgi:OmpA-OmpF porin, OOP family